MATYRKEIRVDEDIVGWDESGVVLEEERGGDLWSGLRQWGTLNAVRQGRCTLRARSLRLSLSSLIRSPPWLGSSSDVRRSVRLIS